MTAPARACRSSAGEELQGGRQGAAALPGAVLGPISDQVGKLRAWSRMAAVQRGRVGLPKGEDGLLILSPDGQSRRAAAELFPGTPCSIGNHTQSTALLSHVE